MKSTAKRTVHFSLGNKTTLCGRRKRLSSLFWLTRNVREVTCQHCVRKIIGSR